MASVVFGFNMITSSQVFAKNGKIGDVKLIEEYRSKDRAISSTSTCLAIVPDKNGSTCIQGMASDDKYIYVVKINRDKLNEARIYRFDPKTKEEPQLIKNSNGKEFSDFGHAGDMTAVKYMKNTYLIVLNKKTNRTIIHVLEVVNNSKNPTYTEVRKFEVSKNEMEKGVPKGYKLNFSGEIGSIAADFIDANNSKEAKKLLYFRTGHTLYEGYINMGNLDMGINALSPIELKFDVGGLQSQGMCHYRSNNYNQLYIVYSFDKKATGKKRKENIIIEYNLDGKKKGEVNYDSICTESTKIDELELESCAIIGTTVYCCTNCQNGSTTYDGIYRTSC